ncbi:uncharacterized protein ARMOST_18118 [Armillaria ostoyae]|uniref:Uncharacterized protein n=1 Tax=Armillaria ostoyae TaxID=47428 RepID=A0A284S0Y2_ARMOS|nr:uncharacterized protein ARMOST_18118 [Armillaria ostoyae]
MFAPNLEIIHRPGQKHSNVDPLSRLVRDPPSHISPEEPEGKSLQPSNDLIEAQEIALNAIPMKRIEVLNAVVEEMAIWRRTKKCSSNSDIGGAASDEEKNKHQEHSHEPQEDRPDDHNTPLIDQASELMWDLLSPSLPALHISIDNTVKRSFIEGHKVDI